MREVAGLLLSVLGGGFAVASLVTIRRHWPPTMDSAMSRRITKLLRRGALPTEEPDRSAAVRLAQGWANGHWAVLMLLCIGIGQWLLVSPLAGGLGVLAVVAAAVAVAASILTLLQVVAGRRALRRARNSTDARVGPTTG